MLLSMWRNCNPHALLVGLPNSWATLKNSLAFLQNIKHSYRRPSNSTPRYKPKESIMSTQKHVYDDHSSIICNSQEWKYSIWLMNGQTMWWNTIWQHKGMKYWYILQHGWTMKILCSVKLLSHKDHLLIMSVQNSLIQRNRK